jgi:hypothetical protein
MPQGTRSVCSDSRAPGNRNWAQIVKGNALDAASFQSIRALRWARG